MQRALYPSGNFRKEDELINTKARVYADHVFTAYGGEAARPKKRGDCKDGPRPCPWVGCTHNTLIEVQNKTIIKDAMSVFTIGEHGIPTINPELLGDRPTCVLDVVDAHPDGLSLEHIASFFGYTRENIRRIEEEGKGKLFALGEQAIDEYKKGPVRVEAQLPRAKTPRVSVEEALRSLPPVCLDCGEAPPRIPQRPMLPSNVGLCDKCYMRKALSAKVANNHKANAKGLRRKWRDAVRTKK